MPDLVHRLPIWAPMDRVFEAVSQPAQLDEWWSEESSGQPRLGEHYQLGFGAGYDWSAEVTECQPPSAFELTLVDADPDWVGTAVRFDLAPLDGGTTLTFAHKGWPSPNDHYLTSSYCWAMYLRIMKRFIEHGEHVPYASRLEV